MAASQPLPRLTRRRLVALLPVPPLLIALVVALVTISLVIALVIGAAPASADAEPVPSGEWPLAPAPEVVAGFDPPASQWGSGHRGVDLLGTPGQPVRAALPGRVSFAGRIAGRGIVVVDHGDTRTTYEPVRTSREVGAVVRAGERIGVLETFGSHCFPRSCLHWGWVRDTTYLDPLLLVGAGPVRLLPLWGERPPPMAPGSRPPPVSALPYAARPRSGPTVPTGWSSAAGPWAQARGCACW